MISIQTQNSTLGPLRQIINDAYLVDETEHIKTLLANIILSEQQQLKIGELARCLVNGVRLQKDNVSGINAFLQEYDLSSREGVVLLCLAEALLRIPDSETADKLIRDKLCNANWEKHLGRSHSMFVNASTWGLMLTGRIAKEEEFLEEEPFTLVNELINRVSEPVVRAAIREAMRFMGNQFVMGETIEQALQRSVASEYQNNMFSYDMLGEAALSEHDAQAYFESYMDALHKIGKSDLNYKDIQSRPSISIKLSALHPRLEVAQKERVMRELVPKVLLLSQKAHHLNVGLTIDGEEAERLDLTLDIFECVFSHSSLKAWNGLGMVVQAYQKRAFYIIDWVVQLATIHDRQIMLRLVKGAYWDSEIKWAQERGLSGYPVFTRKEFTDISYLACLEKIYRKMQYIYPQFATHNARTLATVLTLFDNKHSYEVQRLLGMGEALYKQVESIENDSPKCRIYAPVGKHKDLLPYLVRRLLENGANTSFINKISDVRLSISQVVADPIQLVSESCLLPHPAIPLPGKLFGAERENSKGINLNDQISLNKLLDAYSQFGKNRYHAGCILAGEHCGEGKLSVFNPANRREIIGTFASANSGIIDNALSVAVGFTSEWARTSVASRVSALLKVATLIESNRDELLYLCVNEAGKCITDGLAEIREAVDFCRYYAYLAENQLAHTLQLKGPTGEQNSLTLNGRGTIVCISPWNFPLAIFCGQIAAALVAGNCVIAKPASLTPLIAYKLVYLFLAAGFPVQTLQLLICSGELLSEKLITDSRIAGVAFTGSTEVARHINIQLAQRDGPIVPLIAETGGINTMIVDSSALVEQVVIDVLKSSFNSAGQRCSALRVLYLQKDIAQKTLDLMQAAMAELVIGNPGQICTDVGPVIGLDAQNKLNQYLDSMVAQGQLIHRIPLAAMHENGCYVSPAIVRLTHINQLKGEIFGPIVHVISYKAGELDQVIDSINDTRYGLTLGVHSRIEKMARYIQSRTKVGNLYINRNIIGATVGVQPFGGEGLSGTGPKAGGPHYLLRFSTERVVTNNRSAIGGNTQLLNL